MQNSISAKTESINLDALDSIFGTGINDVLTADESSPSLSTANSLDNKLDNLIETQVEEKEKAKEEVKKPEEISPVALTEKAAINLDNVLNDLTPETEEQKAAEEKKEQGRPKTDKNALASYIIQKIEANDFGLPEDAPFDSKKQTIEQYVTSLPEKELHSILDTNWKAKEEEIRNQTPAEFYEALPDEAKAVAEYAANGGNDWKAFYQAMGKVEEVRALNPDKEEDQIQIAKSYLQAKKFGSETVINEQIEDWKDAGKIEKIAKEFKPQLDAMQKEQIDAYNRQADEQKRQAQELSKFYAQNVYKTLETNELAGIKLDKKFSKELADNLSYSNQIGPWTGRPTNYLGYGLEKAQYVEPDYEAVAIAAWILNDKKAALEALKIGGKNEAIENATKLIKLNQGLGSAEQPIIKTEERKTVKRIPSGASLKR